MHDEIISITDSVSTNVTNTIPKSVTSTVSVSSYDKKVRYKIHCYILHTFLLLTISLFTIVIIKKISINFGKAKTKFYISLHYNCSNS